MESITMVHHEDQPSNSAEEVDHQDVVSGGRLYECIYCKRGFTTAQALGGHMNIHRKDKAKGRPNDPSNSSISSKLEDHSCYAGPRFYQPIFASYPPSYISAANREGLVHHTTYSTSTLRPINQENKHEDVHGVITSPSSLRLQCGWSHGEDHQNSRRTIQEGVEEDELDLELRLGHDP